MVTGERVEDLIEIVDYDPSWPARFSTEREAVRRALGVGVESVEHIGSTAVAGLGAKPTIDLMVGVEPLDVDERIVAGLKSLGYEYLGEYGLPGRQFFRKGLPPTHHIHWVRRGADFWTRQLIFRDFLRAHPERCAAYERFKRGLAAEHAHDRAGYTAAKSDFILDLQEEAWRWAGAALIVFDLEATCWEGGQAPERQEIIEIGAVRLGKHLEESGEFSRFVRPKDQATLSAFCTTLTGIRQQDVAAAERFPYALSAFHSWTGDGLYRLASWSAYDLEQLRRDCARHGLAVPAVLERHLDLQALCARQRKEPPRPMVEAMEREGLAFEGRPHSAGADARNAARLARLLLRRAGAPTKDRP